MKHDEKDQSGSAVAILVAIVAVVIVGALLLWRSDKGADGTNNDKDTAISPLPSVSVAVSSPVLLPSLSPSISADGEGDAQTFDGVLLGGTQEQPLLPFDKSDYDKTLAAGRPIALYFYANWCPICKKEFPEMQAAFNDLESGNVVGFRVNFNDDEADQHEKDLAREFGVAYQHTKVFLKNGEKTLKSPESWNKARYVIELSGLGK